MNLAAIRAAVTDHLGTLRVPEGPVGAYCGRPGGRADLYASLDVALMRTVMGETLAASLPPADRRAWADHINSYQQPDGTFTGVFTHHSQLHAHGMAVGALGALGERMRFPHTLYAPFARVEDIAHWLAGINWAEQWSASHLFWGGMHCYSLSSACPAAWREAVFA